MEDKLAEILERVEALNAKEFEIITAEWTKRFFNNASHEELLPYHIIMHKWEDQLEGEDDDEDE